MATSKASELPWFDFDDFLDYGRPVDPQFKIIPAEKRDGSESDESDSDDSQSDHKLTVYVKNLKLTPQEPGQLLTPKQILKKDTTGDEITALIRNSGFLPADDNYKMKSKKSDLTPNRDLLLDSSDFVLVRKRNKVNKSMQSSSSDVTFYTANDTTLSDRDSNTTVASLDRKYFTPRQIYELKKQKNETI